MRSCVRVIGIVFVKEWLDALRDRRALLVVTLVSVCAGPLLLLMLANMLAGFEARAERRIVLAWGMEHAPSLANHLLRESVRIEPAPADYAGALRTGRLADPVLLVPQDFERRLAAGETATLTIVSDTSNARAQAGVARLKRWLGTFENGRETLALALRGIDSGTDALTIEEHDLASPLAQSARVFAMLPYFLLLAALYGVWGAALDVTVGERERGALDTLRLSPAGGLGLAIGKWLAVSAVGVLIVALATASFVSARAVMPGETLRAMFAFGSAEAACCLALLVPLVMLFAALLMAVGVRARTLREAQASATGVMLLATLLPLFVQIGEGTADWHARAPVIAQHTLVQVLLRGDPLTVMQVAVAGMFCLAATLAALHPVCLAMSRPVRPER